MLDAVKVLSALDYDEHTIELTKIACYLHDTGNFLSRYQHNIYGGLLATQLLQEMQMPIADVALIANAICSHDRPPGNPVTAVAAALIIGDKSDVRRSRVRKQNTALFDIHDKVNYSILHSKLEIENKDITLKVKIDTEYSSKLDFYDIFLDRMLLCREAAEILNCKFHLEIIEV
jgi:metal-dependent HD superfamily phosphatase/phosphodiesterase